MRIPWCNFPPKTNFGCRDGIIIIRTQYGYVHSTCKQSLDLYVKQLIICTKLGNRVLHQRNINTRFTEKTNKQTKKKGGERRKESKLTKKKKKKSIKYIIYIEVWGRVTLREIFKREEKIKRKSRYHPLARCNIYFTVISEMIEKQRFFFRLTMRDVN